MSSLPGHGTAGAERRIDASPSTRARIAGFFYLLVFLLGIPYFLSMRLVVARDPALTTANILAHETLFRLGWAANLLSNAAYVVVTALFYRLFAPVSRPVSLVAAFFSIVGCAIGAVSAVFQLAPVTLLRTGGELGLFTSEQGRAATFVLLRLFSDAYNVALVFFGFYCLLIGVLVLRSTFLPRIFGVLMVIAGVGWLVFLWPPLARSLYPFVLMPGMIGEGALTLRLVAYGVDPERWREQARGGEAI